MLDGFLNDEYYVVFPTQMDKTRIKKIDTLVNKVTKIVYESEILFVNNKSCFIIFYESI